MEPEHIRFGGGASSTLLHPLVAVVLILSVVLILCLPRKYVIVPLLLSLFLIPRGQVIVVGGIHFTVAKILILTGLGRLIALVRSPAPTGGLNSIDRLFALCAISYLTVFSLQWMDVQAFIKGLGDFLDAVGGYFVLRFFIRDREDIMRACRVFALIAMIMAGCMLNEQITHKNVFGFVGGELLTPQMRGNEVRSQAAFGVYITAGVFGASLLPLFTWLWKAGGSKMIAALSILAATVMTITSHSSTPMLAYVAGILGLCFWPFRERMRTFRWGLALLLVVLHLVMKAPVWALIGRIDLTGSSSGFHRYKLVDNCIRHFGDWWLLGVREYNTWGFDMWDLSNQYVAYALTGGLLSVALFIAIFCRSFGQLGTARKRVAGDRNHEWLLWCLGAALLTHVVAYFGIGNFDQLQFAWYALLAMICVAVSESMTSAATLAQEVPPNQSYVAADWGALETDR